MKNRNKIALFTAIFLIIQIIPWVVIASPIFILGAFDFDLDLLEEAINNLAASQYPYTFELNSNGTYTVTGIERTTVKDGEEYQLIYESLVIPSTHEDIPVTAIGNGAFFDLEGLKSVVLPETIVKIDANAFKSCDSLERIELPNGVRYIGDSAFSGCHSLKTVKMPETLDYLGERAFYNCQSLEGITIPKGITEIGAATFYWCFNIKTVTIPEGITSIGASAFYCCFSLTDLYLPADVEMIETYAFNGCTSLRRIHFAGTVSEWKAIEKGDQWDRELRSCLVLCTDGEIRVHT